MPSWLGVFAKGHSQSNLRANARSALGDEHSLQQLRALIHAAQPQTRFPRSFRAVSFETHALPVVLDHDREFVAAKVQSDLHGGGFRVPLHVTECFLHHPEDEEFIAFAQAADEAPSTTMSTEMAVRAFSSDTSQLMASIRPRSSSRDGRRSLQYRRTLPIVVARISCTPSKRPRVILRSATWPYRINLSLGHGQGLQDVVMEFARKALPFGLLRFCRKLDVGLEIPLGLG